jgi:hypothetical protein
MPKVSKPGLAKKLRHLAESNKIEFPINITSAVNWINNSFIMEGKALRTTATQIHNELDNDKTLEDLIGRILVPSYQGKSVREWFKKTTIRTATVIFPIRSDGNDISDCGSTSESLGVILNSVAAISAISESKRNAIINGMIIHHLKNVVINANQVIEQNKVALIELSDEVTTLKSLYITKKD